MYIAKKHSMTDSAEKGDILQCLIKCIYIIM